MNTVHVSDVTQEEFDAAAQIVIAGIKASDPKLDTRVGTVLRSLLVNPEARIEAATSKQIDYVRKSSSLKLLKDAEDAGDTIDVDDVNAIMSNFNIKSLSGTRAEGIAKISVSTGDQSYTIAAGTSFSTIDGLVFTAKESITAKTKASTLKVTANAELYKGASSYFFLVPVVAADVGSIYNIPKGTSLTLNTSLYTFISSEAYNSFDGGSDVSNMEQAIDKIPSGLSIRGFVNKNACEGMLRDNFDTGNYPIVACSTVGYGSNSQRRDKHNVFGIGIGGRIDLYVRNFGDLFTITDTVIGKRQNPVIDPSTGKVTRVDYVLDVTPEQFPGSCWIKSVSSIYDVNSSLDFSCDRVAYDVNNTWHDFDVSEGPAEIFNTVWQGFKVRVNEVPPDNETSGSSSEETAWSEDRQFKVVVYCLPEASELQAYVDRDDIRSVSTDVVVRCPIICNVTVSAIVVYDVDSPIDEDDAKSRIRKFINSLGFVKSLTRSDIVHILKGCGAISVDLSKKDMLYGILHDANGKEYNLSGDALQLDGLATADAMLSHTTAVFAVEEENIQLTLIPNK